MQINMDFADKIKGKLVFSVLFVTRNTFHDS